MPRVTSDRILQGLRELCAEQGRNPRSYTTEEIAARCDCTSQNIGQIEKKARGTLVKRLRSIARESDISLPKLDAS